MRYLSEFYWNNFNEKTSDKVIRSGIAFENLIEYLLPLEFGDVWNRTKKTHDGGKDFHITTENHIKWAECKNYQDSISLNIIAPTLVMAQIFDVNTLIFFSYSPINLSARKKIYAFGAKTEKKIQIFDEELLDKLIIKHQYELPLKYQPNSSDILIKDNDTTTIFYEVNYIQTPRQGVSDEDKHFIRIQDVKKVFYNSIFELNIFIFNNNITELKDIVISTNQEHSFENEHFSILDLSCPSLKSYTKKFSILPSSGIVNKILLKSQVFKEEVQLPSFRIEHRDEGKVVEAFNTTTVKVKNIWLGEIVLIGENYRQIIMDFENHVLNNDKLSILALQGESGTGKTRLLNEVSDVLLKNHYRIIDFTAFENELPSKIFREIIYFLYEIPSLEILKQLEKNIQNESTDESIYSKFAIAYKLAVLFEETKSEDDIIDIIDNYFELIYEMLSRKKIAIVFDNVQFLGQTIVYFIEQFIHYTQIRCTRNLCVIAFAVNTDYITDKTNHLLNYINKLNTGNIQSRKVIGFNEKLSLLFLRELLNINNDSVDSLLEAIVVRSKNIPFNLFEMIRYLNDLNLIKVANNGKGYVISSRQFYSAISRIPENVEHVIENRWEYFLNRHLESRDQIIEVISCIHLFRALTPSLVEQLNISEQLLSIINKAHFIRLNIQNSYVFDHDIIEAFFIAKYSNLITLYLHKIDLNKLDKVTKRYPYIYCLFLGNHRTISAKELQELQKATLQQEVPLKLAHRIYSMLLSLWMNMLISSVILPTIISSVLEICMYEKNQLGFKQAVVSFQQLAIYFETIDSSILFNTGVFRGFIGSYADVMYHQNKRSEAIVYLENVLGKIQQYSLHEDDTLIALTSAICNRLHMIYKENRDEYSEEQQKNYLLKAKQCTKNIKDIKLRNEFEFLNASDEGYLYYCSMNDKNTLTSIWNKCLEYPPDILPQKAMNYYRKKIQLSLIDNNINQVISDIKSAKSYLRLNPQIKEELVFYTFFNIAEAAIYIINSEHKHDKSISMLLEEAYKTCVLYNESRTYTVLVLKGIYCFYLGECEGTYYNFKAAYELLVHHKNTRFYDEKHEYLVHNILIAFTNLNIFSEQYNCDFLNTISDFSRKRDIKGMRANSILQTRDSLFNVPPIM